MNNNQNLNTPPQNWNQPSLPPKKSRGKIKWILIITLGCALLAYVFYQASVFGKKIGKEISKETGATNNVTDSLAIIEREGNYAATLSQIDSTKIMSDSLRADFTSKVNELKSSSSEILAILNQYADGFNDTLKNESILSQLNQQWALHYFIKSGRATKLKNLLLDFQNKSVANLPSEEQEESLLHILAVYNTSKSSNKFISEFASWENVKFGQPAMNVRLNISGIRSNIIRFENAVLEHYKKNLSTVH